MRGSVPEVLDLVRIAVQIVELAPIDAAVNGQAPAAATTAAFRGSYWTPAQMLCHHAGNGCALEPGDLLGSGTVSGPGEDSRACLAEISELGKSRSTSTVKRGPGSRMATRSISGRGPRARAMSASGSASVGAKSPRPRVGRGPPDSQRRYPVIHLETSDNRRIGQVSAAPLPALIAGFSSSLLRCLGADTKVSSTI